MSELGRVPCAVLVPSACVASGRAGTSGTELRPGQGTADRPHPGHQHGLFWGAAATVLARPPHCGSAPHLVLGLCLLHLHAHSGSRFCVPGVTLSCHHVSKPDQLDPHMKEGLYRQRIF